MTAGQHPEMNLDQMVILLQALGEASEEGATAFDRFLPALRQAFGSDFAALLIEDDAENIRIISDPDDSYSGVPEPLFSEDLDTGATPITLEDLEDGAQWESLRALLMDHGLEAFVRCPLRARGAYLGSLLLAYRQAPHWTSRQGEGLDAIASHVALRLDGIRRDMQVARRITILEEQIERRTRAEQVLQEERELLRLLQEVAAFANEAQSFEEALRFTVDHICAYTKWPVGHVFWLDDGGKSELISSGIWHCSLEGEITDFQKATSSRRLSMDDKWLARYLAEEVVGWRPLADGDEDVERIQAAAALGLLSSFSFPVRLADRLFAVLEFFTPSETPPPEPLVRALNFVAAQLAQVVSREETQRALRHSETMLAEAQRLAHLGSWEWDIRTGRLTWSDELYRIYGVSRSSFAPTYEGFIQLVHPEDRERVSNIVQTAYQRQEPFDYYHRIVRGDGIVRTLHARGYTVADEEGNTVRMYGSGQDVTSRQQTEEALRKSEKSYRTLARNIPDAIVALFDNDLKLILVEGSIPASAATALVPGAPLQMIFADAGREEGLQPYVDALQGKSRTFERTYEGRYFQVRTVPVRDEDGQIFAGIAMAQDITELKKSEEKLIARAQQIDVLHEMGQTVAASLDLEVVFNRVLETLRPLLDAEGVFVLLQEDPETLVFAAANEVGVGNLRGQRVPATRGVASDVLRTGKLQWLQGDETLERVYYELKEVAHYHPRAIIAAPMKLHGKLIGVLEAVHSQPDGFGEEEKAMMETAASWVAIAIGNARQHGRLQHQLQESEALATISRALSQTLDLDKILNLIVGSARDLVSRAAWSIFFVVREEHGRRRLQPVAYSGLEPSTETMDGAVGELVPQHFLSLALDSALAEPDEGSEVISFSDDGGVLIAVPVQGREGNLGVLSVQSSTPEEFSVDDRRLLTMLGRQAAMAVDNARLYQNQQRARRAADTLRAANVALSQSLRLDTVLETLLDYARELVGYERALVLLARRRGHFGIEAARGFGRSLAGHTVALQDYPALQSILSARTAQIVPGERCEEFGMLPVGVDAHDGSWLLLPLISGERALGLLALERDGEAAYVRRQANLAEGLAAQATVAVQNALLFAEVQSNQDRLRLMSRQIISAQEEERQRISRELHDEAGQALTALKISLEMLRSAWPELPEFVDTQLVEAIDMTDQTMEQIRLLAHDLRPPVLDTFGLATSVEGLARDFGRRTRLNIDLQSEPLPNLSDAVAISFYRFVQETLTNVARHADASEVKIELRRDNDKILVCVTDDGKGFETEIVQNVTRERSGIGLMGMQDRFELLNGWVEIKSAPGQGTSVSAYVPYQEDE